MELKIVFSKFSRETPQTSQEQLPWERVKSIRVIGSSRDQAAQRQMKRYLYECERAVKGEIKRQDFEKLQKRFRYLRSVKKSIQKTINRLRVLKMQEPGRKPLWQDIQERQERLMLERWPLILEREEDYRHYNLHVIPHATALLAGHIDPVVLAEGQIIERKKLKTGQKATFSQGLRQLSARLRILEAQLDIYNPSYLPKKTQNWRQELGLYLGESLDAMKCSCRGCEKLMNSVCARTGKLFCSEHAPKKEVHEFGWASDLARSLIGMSHSL